MKKILAVMMALFMAMASCNMTGVSALAAGDDSASIAGAAGEGSAGMAEADVESEEIMAPQENAENSTADAGTAQKRGKTGESDATDAKNEQKAETVESSMKESVSAAEEVESADTKENVGNSEKDAADTLESDRDTALGESASEVPNNEGSIELASATFDRINQPDVFIKEPASGTCVVCSVVMMFRRYTLLRGDSDWDSYTYSSMQKSITSHGNGKSVFNDFTYRNIRAINVGAGNNSTLINLLSEHPEGVVAYNSKAPHGVLVTDYTNGTFYAADPAKGITAGRIPLTSCWKVRANNITSYWYITSPRVYFDNTPVVYDNPWSFSGTPGGTYGTNLVNKSYAEVKWIQAALNIIQSAGLTVDGYYGNGTKNAVTTFQRNYGLSVDGFAGPQTIGKLVSELNSRGYYAPNSDTTGPVISDVKVTDISQSGYTVSCTATDASGVDRVQFPTWTALNDQDDIFSDWANNTAARGTKNGNTYTYRVRTSDHNNETGTYYTHIYAYDTHGNWTCYGVSFITVPIDVRSMSIDSSKVNLTKPGDTEQLHAAIKPDNATNKTVTWTSNNTNVATVNSSGLVTAVAAGTATITAKTSNGIAASSTVTVAEVVLTKISVSSMPSKTNYRVGDTLSTDGLTISAEDSYGQTKTVTEGFACTPTTLENEGTQTITVEYQGKQTMFSVTVEAAPTPTPTATPTLTATPTPANGIITDGYFTYQISNGEATLSKCDKSISGDIKIPAETKNGAPVTAIGYAAFDECSSLTSLEIPDNVTGIGTYAFCNCSNLISIKMSKGLKYIGDIAFMDCSQLTDIEIPSGVTSIGDSAFRGCSSLTSIKIPNGVTSIGSAAFWNCSSLKKLDIPASVTDIALESYYGMTYYGPRNIAAGCGSLIAINVDDNNVNYRSVDGILFNKNMTELYAYPAGKNGDYVIPDSVINIERCAFEGCNRLNSVYIPDGVRSIGEHAFKNCTKLTSVNIPNGITELKESLFEGCESLKSIEIPESVTDIDEFAFSGTGLTGVIIPKSVTVLWRGAVFTGCRNLKAIEVEEGNPTYVSIAIRKINAYSSST